MLKLLMIIPFLLLLAASDEPQNLTLGEPEPEPLSLSSEKNIEGELSTGSTATIEVRTIPREALIYIDGKHLGLSPINGETVSSGEHYISIKKKGYFPYDKDILLPKGESVLFILPLIEVPPGYPEALRIAESRAGVIFDLQIGAFRKWLHSPERHAAVLVGIANSCLRLADALEDEGLDHDALQCRNTVCGFYSLLELAAGSSYFADESQNSVKLAQDTRPDAATNDAALLKLVNMFIAELSSDDPSIRAGAAHALRHTYCSFDGAQLAGDALATAGKSESDGFVLFAILEALEQITFEPGGSG